MIIDRNKAKKAFNDYVADYDTNNEKISLKIYHTFKVSEICDRLARSLNFKEEDIDLAWLIGLLHDIGRFEQVRIYGIFNDLQSVDHAELGVKILFAEGKIRDFILDNQEDEVIKKSILYHNDFEIPNDLSERISSFCNILRDADKIDIFRVNTKSSLEDIYNVTIEKIYNSMVSDKVMESFKQNSTILRELKKTPVDNIVGHIALVFGLKYKESLKIVKEQGYLAELLNFKSRNNKTNEQFKEIRNIVNQYIV